jgi:hypothetical protein
MRKNFPGYYCPTEDEFVEMWEACTFAIDANVLLNLYRYSPETREELIGILAAISDRLWVPYQAALEYHRNRIKVIEQQASAYDKLRELLSDTRNKLENDLRSVASAGRHPFISADRLLEKITTVFIEIEEELEGLGQEHPDLVDNDPIKNAIAALLEGKVGAPYSLERSSTIHKEGKTRYENEVPPGYRDASKGGIKQYGDLVLWFQIIDHAKESKGPVILVTDDRKDDWWLRFKGRTTGPRPELVNEMVSKADVLFYMYSTDPFMERARDYLERQVKQQAIDEVREIRKLDENYLRAVDIAGAALASKELLDSLNVAMKPTYDLIEDLRLAALPAQEMIESLRLAAQPTQEMIESLIAATEPTRDLQESLSIATRAAFESMDSLRLTAQLPSGIAEPDKGEPDDQMEEDADSDALDVQTGE